jgi:hypothetical protein
MTQAVVLRRASGHWSAFLARVRRCEIEIPKSVADTASSATMQRYVVEARRRCVAVDNVGAGARLLTTDTLIVDRLDVAEPAVDSVWTAALSAGALQLPPRVNRPRAVNSDFTYVIELRRGNEYRASAIEHVDPPERDADRSVQRIYAAVSHLLPANLVVKP